MSYNLLMIDDHLADIRLMKEAIKLSGLNSIASSYAAHNWQEAFHILESNYEAGIYFDIVLLDLNMPQVSGREILKRIRNSRKYSSLPVFILSNSDYKIDIADCLRLGASAYFQKPDDFMRLIDFFRAIKKSLESMHGMSVTEIKRWFTGLKIIT